MHPFSSLGPVDPQITIERKNQPNASMQFSSEDLSCFIDFLKSDVGISDQAHLISAFNALASEIGPREIGFSKRSQQLSLSLSQKLLEAHMSDKNKASAIAKSLMSSYYHHGYAVSRKEAKDIGLPVTYPEQELEEKMWGVWMAFCDDMQCAVSFDPLQEVLKKEDTYKRLMNVPIINVPVDLPEPLKQQVYQNVLTQQVITNKPADKVSVFMAAIESCRKVSQIYQNFEIIAWRDNQMKLLYNVTAHSEGWKEI